MLAKDNATRDTLRMLISEIKRYEIDNRIDADDSVVLATLKKMIKQRKDSIEQFDKGGRADLSEIEKNELEKKYKELADQNEILSKRLDEFRSKEKVEERKQIEFSEKIDELNQETDTLLEEIDKWQM